MTMGNGFNHLQHAIEEDHSQAKKTVVPELIQKGNPTPTFNFIPISIFYLFCFISYMSS